MWAQKVGNSDPGSLEYVGQMWGVPSWYYLGIVWYPYFGLAKSKSSSL